MIIEDVRTGVKEAPKGSEWERVARARVFEYYRLTISRGRAPPRLVAILT